MREMREKAREGCRDREVDGSEYALLYPPRPLYKLGAGRTDQAVILSITP